MSKSRFDPDASRFRGNLDKARASNPKMSYEDAKHEARRMGGGSVSLNRSDLRPDSAPRRPTWVNRTVDTIKTRLGFAPKPAPRPMTYQDSMPVNPAALKAIEADKAERARLAEHQAQLAARTPRLPATDGEGLTEPQKVRRKFYRSLPGADLTTAERARQDLEVAEAASAAGREAQRERYQSLGETALTPAQQADEARDVAEATTMAGRAERHERYQSLGQAPLTPAQQADDERQVAESMAAARLAERQRFHDVLADRPPMKRARTSRTPSEGATARQRAIQSLTAIEQTPEQRAREALETAAEAAEVSSRSASRRTQHRQLDVTRAAMTAERDRLPSTEATRRGDTIDPLQREIMDFANALPVPPAETVIPIDHTLPLDLQDPPDSAGDRERQEYAAVIRNAHVTPDEMPGVLRGWLATGWGSSRVDVLAVLEKAHPAQVAKVPASLVVPLLVDEEEPTIKVTMKNGVLETTTVTAVSRNSLSPDDKIRLMRVLGRLSDEEPTPVETPRRPEATPMRRAPRR